jgi:hypothetical protein
MPMRLPLDGGRRNASAAVAADETLLGCVAQPPRAEAAAAGRLAWFARWPEDADPAIAEG